MRRRWRSRRTRRDDRRSAMRAATAIRACWRSRAKPIVADDVYRHSDAGAGNGRGHGGLRRPRPARAPQHAAHRRSRPRAPGFSRYQGSAIRVLTAEEAAQTTPRSIRSMPRSPGSAISTRTSPTSPIASRSFRRISRNNADDDSHAADRRRRPARLSVDRPALRPTSVSPTSTRRISTRSPGAPAARCWFSSRIRSGSRKRSISR